MVKYYYKFLNFNSLIFKSILVNCNINICYQCNLYDSIHLLHAGEGNMILVGE